MLEVKFNTVEEINEQLKSQLGKLMFKGYSENTDKEIEKVFKEVEKFASPQSLVLEDIQSHRLYSLTSCIHTFWNKQESLLNLFLDNKIHKQDLNHLQGSYHYP